MKARDCPFCGTESSPLWLDDEASDWRSVRTRTLGVVGQITLCAGLGAIAEPYVLAYPRNHYLALADLDATNRHDLFDALDLCLTSGLFPSGKLSVFEHGGSSPENSTGCLEHCHLHLIDGSSDLQPAFRRYYPHASRADISEATNLTATAGYLFAGNYNGRRIIEGSFVQTPSCGSQFFRRLLAAQTGSMEWNWRLSPKPEVALHLVALWRERLETLARTQ